MVYIKGINSCNYVLLKRLYFFAYLILYINRYSYFNYTYYVSINPKHIFL